MQDYEVWYIWTVCYIGYSVTSFLELT
jgi:hypothetical protein